ncbi:cytochrome b-c1 complex subunit 7 isoform X2 [Heterocephalus glaber]|uniref:Cytochrome b-c1 complex subunit 7 n=1 Tax=Heterocephalus glaber TaxID=10181 RepID=A0AAX6TAX3_HETGA|nr:cytochrome b-c1 complex subunit 7 isoform X2 [Heterocephalus glaber]
MAGRPAGKVAGRKGSETLVPCLELNRNRSSPQRLIVKLQVHLGFSELAASGRWLGGIRKWYYSAAGFNKLGLMRDDTMYEDEDVKEAIRRLPENLYNDRMFRIKRALDLTLKHQILPKEQWTKYEEDKCYLEPYLKEVIREREEREEWAKK